MTTSFDPFALISVAIAISVNTSAVRFAVLYFSFIAAARILRIRSIFVFSTPFRSPVFMIADVSGTGRAPSVAAKPMGLSGTKPALVEVTAGRLSISFCKAVFAATFVPKSDIWVKHLALLCEYLVVKAERHGADPNQRI
jgi:hypothetical protein